MPNIKSKDPWDMGVYYVTPKDYLASAWCLKNSITVYPVAKSVGQWWLEIDINGNVHRSPHIYPKNIVWQKLHEYYRYYYDKK